MLLRCFRVAIGHGDYLSICPRREFSSLEKLNSGVVIMGSDTACQMVGIGSVRIKMFDGVIKDFDGCEICSSDKEEHHLSWSYGVERAQDDIGE